MITTAQQILESFDTLSDSEKHHVAVEILRRSPDVAEDDMIESLHVAAEEGFLRMDAEEDSQNGDSNRATR